MNMIGRSAGEDRRRTEITAGADKVGVQFVAEYVIAEQRFRHFVEKTRCR